MSRRHACRLFALAMLTSATLGCAPASGRTPDTVQPSDPRAYPGSAMKRDLDAFLGQCAIAIPANAQRVRYYVDQPSVPELYFKFAVPIDNVAPYLRGIGAPATSGPSHQLTGGLADIPDALEWSFEQAEPFVTYTFTESRCSVDVLVAADNGLASVYHYVRVTA